MTDEQNLEPVSAEEKLAITKRLQAVGALEAFNQRREEIRQEKKKAGASKPHALAKSWRQAMAEFANLLEEQPTDIPVESEEQPKPETVERFKSACLDVAADVSEAYEKLGQPGLMADDFDRPGSWRFYRFARSNQLNEFKFLNEFVVKFLSKTQANDAPEEWSDRDVKLDDLLAEVEKEFPSTVKCPHCGGEVAV